MYDLQIFSPTLWDVSSLCYFLSDVISIVCFTYVACSTTYTPSPRSSLFFKPYLQSFLMFLPPVTDYLLILQYAQCLFISMPKFLFCPFYLANFYPCIKFKLKCHLVSEFHQIKSLFPNAEFLFVYPQYLTNAFNISLYNYPPLQSLSLLKANIIYSQQ